MLVALRVFLILSLLSSSAHAATITVTTTADSGPGSFRQALADANNGDVINFDPALNNQNIVLTSAQLVVATNVAINGPGADLLTIARSSGAPAFGVLRIAPGASVTIEGLTIRG